MKKLTILPIIAAVIISALSSCKKDNSSTQQIFDCNTMSTITTNTTLVAGVYNITCNIEVSNSALLTIPAGTTLNFSQGMSLKIDAGASISAIGTASSPIIIQGAQAIPGYWNGIFINSLSLTNQFTYCTISDGGASTGNTFGANVTLTGASAGFTNCTVINSKDAGFYLFGNGSSSSDDITVFNTFQNNAISTNGSYPIVTYAAGAGSIGTGNTFTGNANNYIGIPTENAVTVNVTFLPLTIPYEILQLGGTDPGVSFANVFTVSPGATIVMGTATSLFTTATGTIIAKGTSASPIIFKGLQATVGYWGTLAIQSNTANDFEYCNVSGGGGISYFDTYSNDRGLIGTYMYIPVSRNITVRNCTLSNSASAGIYVSANDGPPTVPPTYNSDIVTSNTFSGCNPNVQM